MNAETINIPTSIKEPSKIHTVVLEGLVNTQDLLNEINLTADDLPDGDLLQLDISVRSDAKVDNSFFEVLRIHNLVLGKVIIEDGFSVVNNIGNCMFLTAVCTNATELNVGELEYDNDNKLKLSNHYFIPATNRLHKVQLRNVDLFKAVDLFNTVDLRSLEMPNNVLGEYILNPISVLDMGESRTVYLIKGTNIVLDLRMIAQAYFEGHTDIIQLLSFETSYSSEEFVSTHMRCVAQDLLFLDYKTTLEYVYGLDGDSYRIIKSRERV